jgi:proteasome maturation protein
MEGLRRAYGIAEPVRRGMELKIVRDGTFRPAVLGGMRGGNVHEDILMIGGRDTEVQWEDIYTGMYMCYLHGDWIWMLANWFGLGDDLREPPTFHDEMEKRLKMDF